MIPRTPTKNEISEIAAYCSIAYAETHENCEDALEHSAIAVFDEYITGCPGFSGKVALVMFDLAPSQYQAFKWQDGKVMAIEQDKDLVRAI